MFGTSAPDTHRMTASSSADDEPIVIACALDDRYVPLAGVALYSLATCHRLANPIHAHLFASGVAAERRQMLTYRLREVGVQSHWHDVSPHRLTSDPVLAPYVMLTPHYHRLLMPYLLPRFVKRALYIDVDVMVLADVHELWKTSLDHYVTAACLDYLEKVGTGISNYEALGLQADDSYFNSGVMLIDMVAWRAARVSERVLTCTQRNRPYLDALGKFHQYEQYGLNVVLYRRWKELHIKWNYGSEKPFCDAAIVHFNGHGKPWSKTCKLEFKDLFFSFLERSGWMREYQAAFGIIRPE